VIKVQGERKEKYLSFSQSWMSNYRCPSKILQVYLLIGLVLLHYLMRNSADISL